MQKAETVLSMLGQKAKEKNDFVFDRLYRNLFNSDFYFYAGGSIGLASEINPEVVNSIIEKMKNETYKPISFEEVSGLKKKCDFPLEDRLVQEVMRQILEAIYEPVFKDFSHGNRPKKDCHTILSQIKLNCRDSVWAVRGRVENFFGNINQDVLLNILAKKINDGRFSGLIKKILKAERFKSAKSTENRNSDEFFLNIRQERTIGSMLINIYLHELDLFLDNLYSERNSNCSGINYYRYGVDFVAFIKGNRAFAVDINDKIDNFLNEKLELNLENISITNLVHDKLRFLEYEITKSVYKNYQAPKLQNRKEPDEKQSIVFLVPGDVIDKKLGPFRARGKSIPDGTKMNLPVLDLIIQYNKEIRELYNYYSLATDVSKKLGKFKYYHYYSLVKTIARKEKTSVKQIIKKYGINVKVKKGTGTHKIVGITYFKKEGPKTLTYFNELLGKADFREKLEE